MRPEPSGDAQNLSLPQLEGGVLQPGVPARDVLHVQDDLPRLVGLGGEAVGELPAHHQPDDLVHGELFGRAGGHPLAVPHDGHVVADAENLLHLVADVDDAAALIPEHVDDAEQVLHLGLGEGRGGLVKDDDLGVVAHRLGDLHHLPLGHGQLGHDGVGVHGDLQLLENLPGALVHNALADDEAAHLGVAAQPQVVLHRAGEGLVQLLVHHGHAVLQRLLGAFEFHLPAVQGDGALIPAVNAEQALHQGGLARAVLPHEGVDGAGPDGEVHAVQRLDAGEGLGNAPHFQQCRPIHTVPPLCNMNKRGCPPAAPLVCGSVYGTFQAYAMGLSPRCWRRTRRRARGSWPHPRPRCSCWCCPSGRRRTGRSSPG